MRDLILLFFCCLALAGNSATVLAQGDEGFTRTVPAATQGEERSRQSSLWVMEVQLKPMRLIWVDMKNPQTGEVQPELFHYICYRAVNRPMPTPAANATKPVNQLDPEPGPPFFIPEFTLIAEDSDDQATFLDVIVPEAQAAINKKERRQFKNSVTISGPVPEATDAAPNDENAVYGVAIFRGVNPAYDKFVMYMNGFSNGYTVTQGPEGETILSRKTIQQRFWRPGDEFAPESMEFRFEGEPQWIYRPDATVKAE